VTARRALNWGSKASIAAALLACSPAVVDAPPGPDAAVDAKADASGSTTAAACASYAYARCSFLASCSATAVQNRYGSTAECESLLRGVCETGQAAPSTGSTPATASACIAALTSSVWKCSDYIDYENIPPACQTPTGSLPDDAACGVSQQCQSGYCALPLYGACGTCVAVPPAGRSCAEYVCPPSLTCVTATQTCVSLAQQGAACGAAQPCSDGLTCVVGSGATSGTCQPSAAMTGQACSFAGAGCNFYDGLACNVQSGLCANITLGAPGQACGFVGDQAASCIGGVCARGVCVAWALPGQACDIASGPSCVADARCILSSDSGTAGTCELNGATACP
jgi:hypothetical protein